jgi:D-serine deaminase-like pyridoxal phosphate-dependent protein
MHPQYQVRDVSAIYSPALLFYKPLIEHNIAQAVALAGSPERLRPHAKTHKTREIIRLEMAAGIGKHKCATLAEAEMIAGCGARDVFIAYNMVGPNCQRLARLAEKYPDCRFSVTGDDAAAVEALAEASASAGVTIDVLLDLDVGQHRTGMAPGPAVIALYELVGRLPGLRPGGIHAYDGHNHQEKPDERQAAVSRLLGPVLEIRVELLKKGLPVPRLVMAGTPTFPVYAHLDVPGLECTPGTFVLHDHGYGTKFTDLKGFVPAALLLTRVISRPTANRVTLDLGYKAVASDPPAGKRCALLDLPDYEAVLQNEEHLVIETPAAAKFKPGDVVYAMPTHICPTVAMHKSAYVIAGGRVIDTWEIIARDRVLSV